MEQHQRDFFISRIDAGYLLYRKGDLVLRIYPPSKNILYEANEIYNSVINDEIFCDAFTEDELLEYLIENEVWNEDMNKDFEKLPKTIENLKVGLFEHFYKEVESKQIRGHLLKTKNEYTRLHEIRHSWDSLTIEGTALFQKSQYILTNSTFLSNGSLYDFNEIGVLDLLQYQQEQGLAEFQIRELARSEPWSSMWVIRKHCGNHFVEPFTQEQKALVIWSLTYDIVNESPDRPDERVIEDDDALDGWFVLQKKKRLKEKAISKAEKLFKNPKLARAQEVFIPAGKDSEWSVEEVEMLNDINGRVVRQQRFNKLSEKTAIPLVEFPDIQNRIRAEIAEKERGR